MYIPSNNNPYGENEWDGKYEGDCCTTQISEIKDQNMIQYANRKNKKEFSTWTQSVH